MRTRQTVTDALLAGALALIGLLATAATARVQPERAAPDGLTYALILAAALPLAARRVWPLPVLAATTLAVSTYLVLGYPFGPILLTMPVAVYTVASRLPLKRAAMASAAALVLLLVHLVVEPAGLASGLAIGSAWVVVPFAIGVVAKLSREARANQARRVADDERLRIAQEVHDVVGHGLAAIHMQSEIALHVLGKRPEQAEAALTAISRTSKEALDELRATLAVVRRGSAPRDHPPGLEQLDVLITRIREAGIPVAFETTGPGRQLPTAVDLAAYRIIQESLTNVLRHAGPASASVNLNFDPEELVIDIVDTGHGTAGNGTGHGIEGMRERAEALGGTVQAGPVQSGQGWRVQARLPVAGAA